MAAGTVAGTGNALGPLVECPEANDPDSDSNVSISKGSTPAVTVPTSARRPRETSSSKEKEHTGSTTSKRRRTGSRLSLSSLFSFNSNGGARERSRSGWSCEEVPAGGEVSMSSVSASDLRIVGTRRYRGSDAGFCETGEKDGGAEAYDLLLGETEDETASAAAAGDEHDETEGKDGTLVHKTSEQDDGKDRKKTRECPLCCLKQPPVNFPKLLGCYHRSCRLCLIQYIEMEIMENRVEVQCPECSSHLHPSDIRQIVGFRTGLIEKYEQFSIRRYLLNEPDVRWCPSPDCEYAVIASSCAACPQLKCGRPECGTLFCYHCKGVWHANQTCDEARKQRGHSIFPIRGSRNGSSSNAAAARRITVDSIEAQLKPGDIKACPRCKTFIVKADDGSCNHMVCAMCSAEFCCLCLKEISDLHYLSPTGCTFWGKKPWTRKKKLLWQLGTLVGAPLGIALIAGISVPGIIFGVPIFVGKKVYQRFLHHPKSKRRLITVLCVVGSLIVSPVLALLAIGVGIPIALSYVYGVIPLSLCRNGACGLAESNPRPQMDSLEEEQLWTGVSSGGQERETEQQQTGDGQSLAPALSIHSGMSSNTAHQPSRLTVSADPSRRRPSIESGVNSLGERFNYEEASVRAMAGSQYHYDDKSVHTLYSGHGEGASCYSGDEVASTKALAGSVVETKSLCSLGALRYQQNKGTSCDEHGGHPCACQPQNSNPEQRVFSNDDMPSTSTANFNTSKKKYDCSNRQASVARAYVTDDPELLSLIAPDDPNAPSTSGAYERETVHRFGKNTSGGTGHFSGIHIGSQHEEPDPFKIRTLLDNMKQMVAADIPMEKPYEPAPIRQPPPQSASTSSQRSALRRSGSGRSLATTVSMHQPAVQPKKRGFFASLFRSK
ncbi:hypothetical protein WR25_18116 [Diploscapter pachys]|uniref:RBR-type E3 ubiquitin transferase n=1 Tax=Diploscapter pachys TaxID=2018661 RepID=A0A2A2J477_9BILA|nr:hypothetical protein WR25_18116 [Diploscapter pachys]